MKTLLALEYLLQMRKCGSGVEYSVDKLAHKADDGGVDGGGYERAESDAVEGSVSDLCPVEGGDIAEKREREYNGDRKEGYVKHSLDLVDGDFESVCDLGDEQLVYLEGHICTKEAGNAEAGDNVAHDKHHIAEPYCLKADAAKEPQKEIERVAVENCDGEGKQVAPVEAAYDDTEQNEHNALDYVFHNTDADGAP